MIDFICILLTIGAGYLAHTSWHSWPLTIAISIAAISILRNLKPFVERPWQRNHPPVKVDVLKTVHQETVGSNGVHFLIMTQLVYFNCRTQEDTDYLVELCDECVEKLMQNEAFKYRYNYVQAKRYPEQFAYTGCGKSDANISVHYINWIKSFGLTSIEGYKNDQDLFTLDDTITLPDGTTHRIMFQALFDPKLPVMPEKK